MSCPDDSSAPIACNRQPFLSDDGCDRGSVDIHRFSALPFCDTIDPTLPEIPDEILDTPMQMFIPPPCVCVNMNYDVLMKYRKQRDFVTQATFKADGDCCDGNYRSDFNLEIPCPVVGNGPSKRISMKLGYGAGGASAAESYIANNPDNCTIEPRNVDFDLHLPCPVKGAGNGKITASIKYGNGAQSATASFIEASPESCAIKPLTPRLDLNIPCPVAGQDGDKKIKASIKYGTGAQSVSVKLAEADVTNCAIKVAEPDLNLNLPCPVKGSDNGVIKASIKYGTGAQSTAASFIEAKSGDCTIRPLSPNLNLNIPCPVQSSGTKTISVGVAYGGNAPEKKSVTLATTNKDTCAIDINNPDLDLKIPCPVRSGGTKTISVGVAYGDAGTGAKSATLAEAKSGDCTIDVKSPSLSLNIPCPVRNDITQQLTVGVTYADGDNGKKTARLAKASKTGCTVELETPPDLDLHIRCPIRGVAGKKKIIASVGYGQDTERREVVYMETNPANCTMVATDAKLDLQIECPIRFDQDRKLKLGAKYATQPQPKEITLATKDSPCGIDILPFGPDQVDLELQCPFTFTDVTKNITVSHTYGQTGSQAISLMTVDTNTCTVSQNTQPVALNVPCPFSEVKEYKLTAKVAYGADSATGMTPEGGLTLAQTTPSCVLQMGEPNIDLEIPCPVNLVANDNNKDLKLQVQYVAPASTVTPTTVTLMRKDPDKCKLQVLPNMGSEGYKLDLKCPISSNITNNSPAQIKVSTLYETAANGTANQFLNVLSKDKDNCEIVGINTTAVAQSIYIPCPLNKTNLEISTSYETSCDSAWFGLESDTFTQNQCKRKLKFKIKFPKGGGGGGTGGMNLVKGADTNIVFTPLGSSSSDPEYGEIAVDVYYI